MNPALARNLLNGELTVIFGDRAAMRNQMLLAAILAWGCTIGSAQADSMLFNTTDIGKSITLDYNGFNGSSANVLPGLAGTSTFTLAGVSGNTYSFNYSVANTSSAPVTASRISSFAFDTDPTILSASSTGAFAFTTLNSNYPNGIGTVDVCFKDATTGSCAGGGSGGLDIGQSGNGTFALTFASAPTALTLQNFFDRYQSIVDSAFPSISSASGAGKISSSTTSSTSSTSGGTPVPEPGMLGLFTLGFVSLVLSRRRAPVALQRPA